MVCSETSRMVRIFLLLVIAFGLLGALPSQGQAQSLLALESDSKIQPYSAVGRLTLAGTGICTGTLIDPNTVLTAAHCLLDDSQSGVLDPSEVVFQAAYRNGKMIAEQRAAQITLHPDFRRSDRSLGLSNLRYDLALITLDAPIKRPGLRPLGNPAPLRTGDSVGVVSYAMGRTEAPALQDLCAVLVETSGMVMLDCDIDKGASGAPVFATIGGQPRIVSVIAALARQGGRKVALGSALAPELDRLRAASRETALTNGRIMRSGGAKFLRP